MVPDPPVGYPGFWRDKDNDSVRDLEKLYVFDSVLSNSRDKYGEWSENPLAINSFMDISEYVSLQRGGDAK